MKICFLCFITTAKNLVQHSLTKKYFDIRKDVNSMAKTHYSEFNSFLIALQNRGESLRIVDELFEIIHLDGLNSTDASLDRIGCNIGLRAALSMNLENKAEEILSFMEKVITTCRIIVAIT